MEEKEIFERIAGNVCKVVPRLQGHRFRPEDRLRDLGLNSLDRAEVIDMTLESLSLKVPRVQVFTTGNLGELAALLNQRLHEMETGG